MNTFSNIFKKSFLEGFGGSDITTVRILVTLAVTCALALYIFIVYYVATKKTFYSKTFNIALFMIAVITSSIILAMQSNLVISLGMVGALSIVRFRTAIKDPMDLIFLFWSISIGIICGADRYDHVTCPDDRVVFIGTDTGGKSKCTACCQCQRCTGGSWDHADRRAVCKTPGCKITESQ